VAKMPKYEKIRNKREQASRKFTIRSNMLDRTAKYLSILTFAVLYLTALFNIGYFNFVGIHFIGVIDISNIVYSFALIVLFLILFLTVVSMFAFLFALTADTFPSIPVSWRNPIGPALLAVALIAVLFLSQEGPSRVNYSAVSFPIFGAMLAILAYKLWMNNNIVWLVAAVSGSFLLTSFGVLLVGVAIAKYQMNSQFVHYDILTKSGSFIDVRIMRSSSNGVIFSQNGKMTFIPSGEIRLIAATGTDFGAPRTMTILLLDLPPLWGDARFHC
jgi:hypothetical protein